MEQDKAFLGKILAKAASNVKHIVFPEGSDSRVIEAAGVCAEKKIADITILGDADRIKAELKRLSVCSDSVKVIDPEGSEKLPVYAEQFFLLRKHKGITEEKALETVKDPIYFGTMMLKAGQCDGLVAGAVHSTADTVRPGLQIVKAAEMVKTVSSMFFMAKGPDVYLFADCGLNEFPDTDQLVDIVLSTVKTSLQFDFEPSVACLSYSTKGSASSDKTKMVAEVASRAKTKLDDLYGKDKIAIDGELQFDAAFVPEIAAKKAPDSPVRGRANVFIFPDLQAGNICYKAVERLGGFDAYGPILQGLGKPVNDLSRGCSVDDIVASTAITAIQAM